MSVHIWAGKSPDNMTRKELVNCITAFEKDEDAYSFWLRWALSRVSKKTYRQARGYL